MRTRSGRVAFSNRRLITQLFQEHNYPEEDPIMSAFGNVMSQVRSKDTLDQGDRGHRRRHGPELTITVEEDAEFVLVDTA